MNADNGWPVKVSVIKPIRMRPFSVFINTICSSDHKTTWSVRMIVQASKEGAIIFTVGNYGITCPFVKLLPNPLRGWFMY